MSAEFVVELYHLVLLLSRPLYHLMPDIYYMGLG